MGYATSLEAFLENRLVLGHQPHNLAVTPMYEPQSTSIAQLLTRVQKDPDQAHSLDTAHPPQTILKNEPTSITQGEESSVPQSTDRHQIAVTEGDQSQYEDLWKQAYYVLEKREPDLVTDYNKHLAPSESNTNPLSTPESTGLVVERLSEAREKNQWRISLQGKDIKFREAAEKLIKILLWSDEIIKPALSAQPYAALAWSGISILLPVR
jgi:hypothetical protein